ncbi:hypothetical protein AYI68_g3220 [Smittium mucronatum]|uniref:Uncharacterized protein n=1 Tax=Smittium mucronatum TaxID=133383 RepID=A0A1R0H0J1_9FUNG|nr:hypothetical protein AYI68_g3220 [Smittium mucronatum]
MGMVKHNHELREVVEDRDSESLALISIEALELSGESDTSLPRISLNSGPKPQARFSPIIPTVGAVQTLSVVSTGSNKRSLDMRGKGAIPSLRYLLGEGEEYTSDSVLEIASPLAAQQQFPREDLYQSNWYRESASENMRS